MMIMGVSILYPSSLSRLALDALLPRIALRNPCAECRTASFSYCVLQFVPPWLAMRPWWYGVDCEEKFGKKVGPFFSYSIQNFMAVIISVQVGSWLPRLWILPLWLPSLLDIFWQYVLGQSRFAIQSSSLFIRYLTMATLSLHFFNLLPLPHLDGTELLQTILDFLFDRKQEPFVYDLEALETADAPETTRTRRRWKERLGKIISIMTMSAFICSIILGMMNLLL